MKTILLALLSVFSSILQSLIISGLSVIIATFAFGWVWINILMPTFDLPSLNYFEMFLTLWGIKILYASVTNPVTVPSTEKESELLHS